MHLCVAKMNEAKPEWEDATNGCFVEMIHAMKTYLVEWIDGLHEVLGVNMIKPLKFLNTIEQSLIHYNAH